MNDKELIQELKRLSVRDSLQCLGCGHEHRCSTQDSAMTASSGHAEFNCAQPLDVAVAQYTGCAIIKRAVERLEQLTVPETNDPLTLAETIVERLKQCCQDLAQEESEAGFAWAEGFNDGLDCAIHKIIHCKQEEGPT